MFLLTEEFMRRYKDRWIIGAYDCINEPISMTPRREELTPKLVYFYEEIVQTNRMFIHILHMKQHRTHSNGSHSVPLQEKAF